MVCIDAPRDLRWCLSGDGTFGIVVCVFPGEMSPIRISERTWSVVEGG